MAVSHGGTGDLRAVLYDHVHDGVQWLGRFNARDAKKAVMEVQKLLALK